MTRKLLVGVVAAVVVLGGAQVASSLGAFVDEDGSVHERDVEALAAAGVTQGCNPPVGDRFCPGDPVTRGQMAAFLVRALEYPPDSVDRFSDDGGVFEADIQALAAAGVALGCNPPVGDQFCPDDPVTREQVASFLVRALHLPTPAIGGGGQVVFTAGGDIGASSETDAVLGMLADRSGEFFLALGDMSYSQLEPESEWCDYVKGHLGSTFPVELIVGNHEDDDGADGFIGEFAACLPDRMSSTGTYGAEYFFDVRGLVRVIMIGAGNDVDGVRYDYEVGNARYQWLSATIDDARADDVAWVVVAFHKPCLTAGDKTCEVGEDLANLLVEKRVDLVLSGHDHNYQRSKQLDCVVVGSFDSSCVTDDGADGVYARGDGTVFVVAGLMGHPSLYPIDTGDPEYPYFAKTLGGGGDLEGWGFLEVIATDSSLLATFVGATTTYTDSFVIR